MYGSWAMYAPTRTLFDCGNDCASALMNHVYAVEDIFISHCHQDHYNNLPSFIGARAYACGAKEKGLNVYYPESRNMTLMIDYIRKLHPKLPYELNFIEIGPGFTKTFENGLVLEAFSVKHCYNSLAFKILEKRSRLKAGIDPKDARTLAASGQTINENYWANIFAYTLDSASYDLKHIENCAWLIADSTFLKFSDRDENTHASVEEILTWARDKNVKRVILAHISTRYDIREITPFILDAKLKIGFNGALDIIFPNKIYEF